ncbi:MAG: AAA family ATPase [bacterium]|nr:AAA family ATPase [bacterium]
MLRPRLTRLQATEFRSLANVDIPLRPLTVLVGPNGAGKTNVLNVLRFLASTVRFDLAKAVDEWDGFAFIKRQGETRARTVKLRVSGLLTEYASPNALDVYELRFSQTASEILSRYESFTFKRTPGRGRRKEIRVSGTQAVIGADDSWQLATGQTTALATLPRLADDQGGAGIRRLADFLSSIRVLEPDMVAARLPSRMVPSRLADDAGNLAAALHDLSTTEPGSFESLMSDMRSCLPGLDSIGFEPIGGPGKAVAVTLREQGVRMPVYMQEASFGTVRMLALLAALHESDPPPFTGIEEVDHGLHPWAIDILVDRLRAASTRSQILITTHAPTLVNRLKPSELIVCDRDPNTGASMIPCIESEEVLRIERRSGGLRPGELWFSGALDGVPRGSS